MVTKDIDAYEYRLLQHNPFRDGTVNAKEWDEQTERVVRALARLARELHDRLEQR